MYAYLLQVTQGAKDMDALCAEIENSPYAFEIERSDDGELLSATYQHNYVLAQVEPQEIQSRAELEAEYQKRSPGSKTRWRSWAAIRRWPRRLAAPMPNPPGSKRTAPRSAALCAWG